jgi:beta-phosphoglucomutase-like phosphatase (HAD superfamily)
MILLAFDVDGTLDSSAGPVRWAFVRSLESYDIKIGVVSPSGAAPPDARKYLAPSGLRRDNLALFAAEYPTANIRLYISDNNDAAESEAAGFAYVDRSEFAKGLWPR